MWFFLAFALLTTAGSTRAGSARPVPVPAPAATEREILVPFEELNILLENDAHRVLLPREQYDALRTKARQQQEAAPPATTLLTAADYNVKVGQERAEITGTLHLAALDARLRAVPLEVTGVGLRTAQLDRKSAPLAQAADGRLDLFVEGAGDHTFELTAVTPLQTTAASQNLTFKLPMPPASRLHLTMPGDVELKSGAAVVTRGFDEKATETRFELLPQSGQLALVFTLNSRLKRKDRVVTARSVLITEVTEGYEKLHATVSFDVLHRAVDDFQLTLPAAFEVTEVRSPELARWVVRQDGARNVIAVTLREPKTGPVVLGISALRTAPPLAAWSFPKLEPQEVTGVVAVIGVLAESRLEVEALATTQLIPVGSGVLEQAMPASALVADPGRPPLRAVAAFYAPSAEFALTAAFRKPPATLRVTTNLLLTLKKSGLELKGGLAVLAEQEKCFALDIAVPDGWDVTAVTTEDGKPLPFERYAAAAPEPARLHVRLPKGVPPGQQQSILFQARQVPGGWLDDWSTRELAFPRFAVRHASRDIGAVAVNALDDLRVRPMKLEGLTPLNENEKSAYGLAGVATSLAYRYDAPPYAATLAVERIAPRVTAESFSFLRLERDALNAHLEMHYTVEQARQDRFTLCLPVNTPLALAIRGLGDTVVKEFSAEELAEAPAAPGATPPTPATPSAGRQRRWTVLLATAATGVVKVSVDFQQRLEAKVTQELTLPLPKADGVAYQSGFLAVEGDAELDVDVLQHPRKVDIGELVDAQYQPGPRLLGAYGFTDAPPAVNVRLRQHNVCTLPPAIIQRAELATLLSANGVAQSAARYLMRTKALFLEVRLPENAQIWAVTLDGKPARPQSEGGRILLDLPAGTAGQLRDLQVVFEVPVAPLGFMSTAELQAPSLVFRDTEHGADGTVPAMDLQWVVYTPTGFALVQTGGSVVPAALRQPQMAAAAILRSICAASGGIDFEHGLIRGCVSSVALSSRSAKRMAETVSRSSNYEVQTEALSVQSGPGAAAAAPAEQSVEQITSFYNVTSGAPSPLDQLRHLVGADTAMDELIDARQQRPQSIMPPAPAQTVQPSPAKAKPSAAWALEGARSLTIELAATGKPVLFRSLGDAPVATLTLASQRRLGALTWAVALSVLLVGVALTWRSRRTRLGWVAGILVGATVIPALPGLHTLTGLMNGAFYAGIALLLYYPLAAWCRWLAATRHERLGGTPHRAPATTVLLVLLLLTGATAPATAAESATSVVVQGTPVAEPVSVPDNALIVPYTAGADGTSMQASGQVLIPYAAFAQLWNQANPQDTLAAAKPPVPGACAGLQLSGRLDSNEQLVLEGTMEFEVFGKDYAVVPLRLRHAVLAKALLDGKPAALHALAPALLATPAARQQGESPLDGCTLVQLDVLGKGKHRLELSLRIKLQRSGGWLVADAILPATAATALDLTVPTPGTEVRLKHVPDRLFYETESRDQVIRTAVPGSGEFAVQWRPKVTEGQVDQALTVSSGATLDLLEDGVLLAWKLDMSFRRGEREFFAVELPAGYLVRKVEGTNVRGWDLRTEADRQRLDVNLLKPAKLSEAFTVHVWRPGALAAKAPQTVTVPGINVEGAVRHTGVLAVRRSPALEVKTLAATGVRRVDQDAAPKPPALDSPLGVRAFEVYEFVKLPFALNLEVTSARPQLSGAAQSILRIAERERRLETRFALTVRDRPLYRVQIQVPPDLELDRVTAPGVFEWAVAGVKDAPVLNVYLANGVQGEVALVLEGRLGGLGAVRELPLPRLSLLSAQRQEGDIVVQADPAFAVQPVALKGIESVLLSRVFSWLLPAQRGLARLALHQEGGDYSGRLTLQPRQAEVHGYTVTNVRVTDRAVEQTSLLDFTITLAGIQEVKFRLPKQLADARVSVPLLRQKTVTPVAGRDEVLVTLELQDQVMGQLRVLVEHDRLLTGEKQSVVLPAVDTGRTDRQYLAVESAGRDEVMIEPAADFEALTPQQTEWRTVADLFRGGNTQAFIARAGVARPNLTFQTRQRATVETSGARIGLAQTVVVLDDSGAYRAALTCHVDNRTEQVLEIELPPGAALWTARVAGELVKPSVPDAAAPRRVHLPLVKTAAGDLDYVVEVKYGGRLAWTGELRPLTFPLIRTRNINVELSQVELRLPQTRAWFDFTGTVREVKQAAEFAAGWLSYQNKQAKRLLQTLQYGSEFEKARATNNLKQINSSLSNAQSLGYASDAYASQVSQSESILREAQVQIDQAENAQADTVLDDNRSRLSGAFNQQYNSLARNKVNEGGKNWSEQSVAETGKKAQSGEAVNEEWLLNSRINAVASSDDGAVQILDGTDAAGAKVPLAARGGQMAKPGKPGAQPQGKVTTQQTLKLAQGQQQAAAPGMVQLGGGKKGGAEVPQAEGKGTKDKAAFQGRANRKEMAQRYQKKLEEQTEMNANEPVPTVPRPDVDADSNGISDFAATAAPRAQSAPQGNGTAFALPVMPGSPPVTSTGMPGGMTSLDASLPAFDPQRWEVYRFATPRGEITVQARSVSKSVMDDIKRLGAAVVLVLFMVGLRQAARRSWRLPAGGARPIARWFMAGGFLCLLVGVMPVFGALAFVAGLVAWIVLAIHGRLGTQRSSV